MGREQVLVVLGQDGERVAVCARMRDALNAKGDAPGSRIVLGWRDTDAGTITLARSQ